MKIKNFPNGGAMKYSVLILLLLNTILFSQKTDDSWMVYDDSEVAIINITIDPSKLEWIYEHINSDSEHVATVHFKNKWIDETVDSIGFRLRGNTSRDAQKKSFKISFNSFIRGNDFYDVEKLNLNGEHNDPSITRAKFCWDLFKTAGMTSSRAAYAAIYINDEYYGLYISVEHIDENFLAKNYYDASGNLWKCLYPADLNYRGPDPNDYYPWFAPGRPYDLKTNVEAYDFSKLAEFITILNNTSDDLFAKELEKILFVSEVIKGLAIDVLVGSWDNYWALMNNYYIYFEPKYEKFHWIPYDYDNTLGVDWFGVDWTTANPYYFPKVNDGYRPLAERMMDNNQYRNLYTHFLEFIGNNVFDRSYSDYYFIYKNKSKINTFAEDDWYRRLDYGFTIDDFHNSFSAEGYEKLHVKRGLREFIDLRIESVNSRLNYREADPLIYHTKYFPEYPAADDFINVEVSAFSNVGVNKISIQYYPEDSDVFEEIPMTFSPVNGTKIVEEADRWIGTIPALGQGGYGKFNLYIEDNNSNSLIFPRDNFYDISSPNTSGNKIRINELLAINDITNTDQDGEFDDWIELYNTSVQEVDLSEMYLTDNPDNLTKWKFPSQTIIAAGEHLLIWCDEDQDQDGLHTNFKLNGGGEFVAFVDRDGLTINDSLTYPAQTADIAYGRYPDGVNSFVFMDPTPEARNKNIVTSAEDVLPLEFSLSQNYPNPFNPTTNIDYSIPVQTHASSVATKLVVYDIMGKEIALLVYEEKIPGRYRVTFDASELASGVYFYRLTAGGNVISKKMVLLH